MTNETERPDFDRLDEMERRTRNSRKADFDWIIAVLDAYPSIRDYVKKQEADLAHAKRRLADCDDDGGRTSESDDM